MKEHRRRVYFATGNSNKYLEAARIATSFGIRLEHLNLEKQEIQAENLVDIASFAARRAADTTRRSVVVEDAGLFIRELGGFPGPYSSYSYATIGLRGILRLMRGAVSREASFQAAVAYCTPSRRVICFTGTTKGNLTRRPRGRKGFGYDPIFIPNRETRTFAEMSTADKNRFSHRAKAFRKFCGWFAESRSHVSSETS